MDPFSLAVGVGSLVEMSLQVGKYLKDIYEAATLFEDEISSLLREIQDLRSVNKSIETLYRTETDDSNLRQLPSQDFEVWQNTVKTLQECSETLKRLQKVLETITGSGGAKVTGKRDGIKKQLKKQSKDGELAQIRVKLSIQRDSLNVSLTLLNL
jgi:paraquat-inducible protein B